MFPSQALSWFHLSGSSQSLQELNTIKKLTFMNKCISNNRRKLFFFSDDMGYDSLRHPKMKRQVKLCMHLGYS